MDNDVTALANKAKQEREGVDQRYEAKKKAAERLIAKQDAMAEELATPSPQSLARIEKSRGKLAEVRQSSTATRDNELAR